MPSEADNRKLSDRWARTYDLNVPASIEFHGGAIQMHRLTKDSRKNKFAFLAHRFAADSVSPRERNRRRSLSYVEDYAIEARLEDVVKMGCQNVKLFLRGP